MMPGASVASAPAIATPGAPAGYANRVAGYESGGNPNAENPNYPVAKGGPAGPHQFLASTWNDFAKANPDLFTGMSPDQILAARTNPVMSQKATEWYAQQNAPILQKAGILPTPANLAIAHSFGGTGAAGLLGFPDSTPLTKVFKETQPGMADAILKANPQYTTMTVGDIKSKYAAMDGGQYQPAAAPPTTAPAQQAMARPQNNLMMQDNPFLRLAMFSQLSNLFKSQGQNVQQTNNNLLQALAAAGRTSQAAAYDRPINV